MNRAFSQIELKSIDEDQRIIEGWASTPETDRVGDVVVPEGADYKLPIPFLLQHDHSSPIGHVFEVKVTKDGIRFKAKVESDDEPGSLKDLLDRSWRMLKKGLIRFTSIGFKPIEYQEIAGSYGLKYTRWSWLELSAVVVPANAGARITSVKSLLDFQRAASGTGAGRVVSLFGRSGVPGSKSQPPPENTVNIQEQIKQFQNARAAKQAALDAILAKSAESGETLDAEQAKEHDDLDAEVVTIDAHLKRLEGAQRRQLDAARQISVVIPGANDEPSKKAANDRDPVSRIIAVEKKLEKGIGFARLAGCIAAAKGNRQEACQIALERFPEEKQLHAILKHVRTNDFAFVSKAPVDIGTSRDTDWAAPLVNYQNLANEFLEFLRPSTILDQMAGRMRRVPFNVRVPRQTGGATAGWVGEGAPKPVTSLAFDFVSLGYMKLAAIAVITQELARFSSPNADTLVRDDLARAIRQQMDADFVDPANAGTANVKPASITNGVSAIPSSGNTYQDVITDIQNISAPFIAANMSTRGAVWIMSETNALALSLMRLPANEGGGFAYPSMTPDGGTFAGRPVIVSETVGNIVILAQASDILLADDGQVTIDASDQASLQMDSAPTNPVVAATVLISLWQQNLLGIRAERFVTWVKGRTASVQVLSGVSWGQAST